MFDRVCIFTLTGVVLWSTETEALREDVVSSLVRDVILPSKAGAQVYSSPSGAYVTRWSMSNAHGLVAAVIMAKSLVNALTYAEPLVNGLKDLFVRRFSDSIMTAGKPLSVDYVGRSAAAATLATALSGASAAAVEGLFSSFTPEYHALLAKYEGRGAPVSTLAPVIAPRSTSGASATAAAPDVPSQPNQQAAEGQETGEETETADVAEGEDSPGGSRLARLRAAKAAAGSRPSGARRTLQVPSSAGKGSNKGTPTKEADSGKKEARRWDDFSYSTTAAADLDKSKNKAGEGAAMAEAEKVVYSGNGASRSGADLAEEDGDDSSSKGGWLSSATSWLGGLAGGQPLTRPDLAPVVDSLRALLMSKNVAQEVAEALCDSVAGQLVGTKLDGSMLSGTSNSRVLSAVTGALRSSIERVLTPTAPVDILRELRAKRAEQAAAGKGKGQREPYVLVFCGVNGVGKSTTLSKIAFHLKDHGHTVLLAACDSFRAGAVEQLKKHSDRLGIGLHEAGYAKDPVAIASAAIRKAMEEDTDCVLVDTAGRMQNNAQLMLQLAKLVGVNRPDRVLFVGEALVGNDGVDQLVEFNRALTDLSQDSHGAAAGGGRGRIDGIVLTKFDTVDDKVGAALSMTYKTGIPIVFLGVGQQYPDLRKLNTGAVVRSLLQA